MEDKIKANQLTAWYNFAFCSVFFMYFQFLPIDIETQPLGVVICVPIFICFYRKRLEVRKEDKFLLSFLLIVFIYYIFEILFSTSIGDVTMSFFRLIISPICYFFVLKHVEFLHWKSVRFGVWITFITALIELFRVPGMFQILDTVYSLFFRRYYYGAGNRGLCILTTEPSYFVYFAMLLLYAIEYLYGLKKIEYKKKKIYTAMIYATGMLTKSAIVYLFLLIYGIQLYLGYNKETKKKINKVVLLAVILIMICGFVWLAQIGVLENNRFVGIIHSIDLRKSITDILFYSDESMGYRFIMNSIYLMSVFLYPFGMGIGVLRHNWAEVANRVNIDYARNMIFSYTFDEKSVLDAQAYIPNAVGTVGFFSLLLVLFLYSGNRYKDARIRRNILFTVSLFMWAIQSNYFNPVFWFLIGFAKSNDMVRLKAGRK